MSEDYKFGGAESCQDGPSCCHTLPGKDYKGRTGGYWGLPNSGCDIPPWFFEATLKAIKKEQIEFDFLFLLGDNNAHTYFKQTHPQDTVKINEFFYWKIKEYFSDKIVIPI